MPNSHPIDWGINGPVTGGDDFTATITMDGPVSSDTTIALSTSSSVITGPGGAAFPATAVVPNGQSSVTVPLGSVNPPSDASAMLTASANGGSANGTATIRHNAIPNS